LPFSTPPVIVARPPLTASGRAGRRAAAAARNSRTARSRKRRHPSFYLALTFGLESDPLGALSRMAGFIEQAGRAKGIPEALWMTVAATDGKRIYAVRYASDGDAPTLYHSHDMEDLYEVNPDLKKIFSPSTYAIVSEPIGTFARAWKAVPQSSTVVVDGDKIEVRPFVPEAPT
jgi:predicted glutamine amidotransferase